MYSISRYASVYAPFVKSQSFAKCLVLVTFPRKGEFEGTDPLRLCSPILQQCEQTETIQPNPSEARFAQGDGTTCHAVGLCNVSSCKTEERGPFRPHKNFHNLFYLKPPDACQMQARAACCGVGREMSTVPKLRVTNGAIHAQQKISSPSGGASDE